jgi:A/G-specific adenine glycosylase
VAEKIISKKVPVIPCGVALIRRGREFLIAQRSADDTFGSFWEFPGGKKNRGESFKKCIAREVMEELGVKVGVYKRFLDIRRQINNKVIWLNFYLCSYLSGEPRPQECQAFCWVDVAKLHEFKFPPANERVIEKLVAMVEKDR